MISQKDYKQNNFPVDTIENHFRLTEKLLGSGVEIKLSQLLETYLKMDSSLHKKASDSKTVDVSALTYALDRLPESIFGARKIILAQSKEDFLKMGLDISSSNEVIAKSRRRRSFFDPQKALLGCFIASQSDITDLVNLALIFQIEVSKIANIISGKEERFIKKEKFSWLEVSEKEWLRLKISLGDSWKEKLASLNKNNTDIKVSLVSSNVVGYRQVAQKWWSEISGRFFYSQDRPVYFVSSNAHCLTNIIGGFVRKKQLDIFAYIEESHPNLHREWLNVVAGANQIRINDLLYYLSKIYFRDNPKAAQEKTSYEESLGIKNLNLSGPLACDVQIIPVSAIINSSSIDPNLKVNNQKMMLDSRALVVNVEYPLGKGGEYLLSEVLENLSQLAGIYIIGKAAILSGSVGDVQIPSMVFDEQSGKSFSFNNIFNSDFLPRDFSKGILKKQKSVSVRGTILENQQQLEKYLQEGFNIIEMESGPYLSALLESQKVSSSSESKVHSLDDFPFELGIINYASDNPFEQKSLADAALGLDGVESTYLAGISVLQRIIDKEEANI